MLRDKEKHIWKGDIIRGLVLVGRLVVVVDNLGRWKTNLALPFCLHLERQTKLRTLVQDSSSGGPYIS